MCNRWLHRVRDGWRLSKDEGRVIHYITRKSYRKARNRKSYHRFMMATFADALWGKDDED